MSGPPSPDRRLPYWLLRRADQATVAVLVLVGFLSVVGWWLTQGGWQGRLVELQPREPELLDYQVDINEAEWPELAQLPGIGETLAQRIVESRAERPFLDHDDLRRVRGIGPVTLERIRPYLRPLPGAENVAGR